jgi:beta-phosphoglucomutase
VNRLPAGHLFDATVNGTEVRRGKPEPDVFLTAAQKLGIEPVHCAVIEDAPAGVEAARRADMVAIGLLGTAPREKLEAHADLVVATLGELAPDVVRRAIDERRLA